MLTGDKVETAVNIGFACKVLNEKSHLFKIEQEEKPEILSFLTANLKALNVYRSKKEAGLIQGSMNFAAIVDGHCLTRIQRSRRLLDCFMNLSLLCDVLIACRLSPKQKLELVELVRDYRPQELTLAIGDGANDVGMITKANIGVGISGKEGNQAVSQSDYSLSQFKDLKPLLLVHGREAYRKNAYMICYIFYKNLLENLPIVFYGLVSGFSGQLFYEQYMSQVFNLLFTASPILVFATMDQEYPREDLLNNPELYADGI
mmetsp:Transcript_10332/g.17363  ORF Transcript_10332/g.17363 Transcript_10332/m.17363 type:complete len:260 (+) Transcript_10332:260-1039(+)